MHRNDIVTLIISVMDIWYFLATYMYSLFRQTIFSIEILIIINVI